MTKIRSSTQLHIDADLDLRVHKITNLVDGVDPQDAITLNQLNNAVLGGSTSIHSPVSDLTAAKAVISADRGDRMLMLIETIGLYAFDAQSMTASNDDSVIRPTDIASDASAGRWIRLSSNITDIVAILNNAAAITTVADADKINVLVSGVIKNLTWAYVKSILKTYFDTLYNNYVHPNHSGDVTSVGGGAQTIAANAVTNAKAAQMATNTIKGNNTGGTANSLDLTVAQVKVMLGMRTRYYRIAATGAVNGSNLVFTWAYTVASGSEELFKNGQLQNANAGVDYTITYGATTTVTFSLDSVPKSVDGYTDVILMSFDVLNT